MAGNDHPSGDAATPPARAGDHTGTAARHLPREMPGQLSGATSDETRRRLLLIGPLPIPGDQIGGAKVSFERLVQDLRASGAFDLEVVNLARPRGGKGRLARVLTDLRASARVLVRIAVVGRGRDAWAINLSTGGVAGMLPAVCLLAALLRRPLGARVFGGGLHDWWRDAAAPSRWLFRRSARRCSVLALQTQDLVERFAFLGNVRRLPTTRDLMVEPPRRERCLRLLYLGQVREEKGVAHLLEAMRRPPPGVTLSLFGSPIDDALIERAAAADGVTYGGEASPAEVPAILIAHDALVLPTTWRGEGMPGAIIEAFQCGLPVIATRWMQIPELVLDGQNGLLVEPRSPAAIRAAIERLVEGQELYRTLSEGALEAGRQLRSPPWSMRFAQWCLA